MNVYLGPSQSLMKNAYIGGVWTPGANTIAYYPLNTTTTVNDMKGSGTLYNLSLTGDVSFTTRNGVNCAYFSGGIGYLRNTSLSFQTYPKQTVLLWFYVEGTNSSIYQVLYHIGGVKKTGILGSWYKHSSLGIALTSWWASPYEVTNNMNLVGGWHLLTNVTDGSTSSQYIDGTYIQGFTNSLSGVQDLICLGNYSIGSDVGGSDGQLTGCLSECIVENKARSASEISAYYNNTKSNYGL